MVSTRPKIRVRYRKVTNPRLAVAKYYPRGTGGKGKPEHITSAVIKLDPILKKRKNVRFRKVILRHETNEILARNRGKTIRQAHKVAVSKEPAWTRKLKTHKALQQALRE